MRIHSRVSFIVVAAVVAIGLAGCSQPTSGQTEAAAGKSSPTPSAARAVSGTGKGPATVQKVDFPIPDGAKSVQVSFTCAGGGDYRAELGDSMALGQAILTGTCDGTYTLSWPITDRTTPTLAVAMPAGVTWRAMPTFSTADFPYAAALTADCKTFSDVDSEFMNADGGYRAHAISAADWTARVEKATTDLESLASASRSHIHDALTQLHAVISDSHPKVGDISAVMDSGNALAQKISSACDTNQTPIILTGEFGG